MKDSLTAAQVDEYRNLCLDYIDGEGPLLPDWLSPPIINNTWLEECRHDGLDEELKASLYPFVDNVSNIDKFRILIVQRFTCFLAEFEAEDNYIRALEEWMRTLINEDPELRAHID